MKTPVLIVMVFLFTPSFSISPALSLSLVVETLFWSSRLRAFSLVGPLGLHPLQLGLAISDFLLHLEDQPSEVQIAGAVLYTNDVDLQLGFTVLQVQLEGGNKVQTMSVIWIISAIQS